ncbi:MAG: permease [Spirochaetes bacterium]|nr:permease [Spirochaetota bacterium]
MDTILLYVIAGAGLLVSVFKDPAKTMTALRKALKALEGILPQFLVVLALVAVTLAVLDTETISRFIGTGSGAWGVLGASLVGAITLIPGFVAFPAAAALLAGGAGATQIAAFVSSLMMVGVVTLPMEMKYFGKQAAILRNVLAFGFSLVAAVFVGWVVSL